MRRKGVHTFDIFLEYLACPKCRAIIEDRQGYTYRLGQMIKQVECPRCHHTYTVVKAEKPGFGPLFE
jgi:ssDNA-binding Zn-finger/Zn-ribbon topoisomerase 1